MLVTIFTYNTKCVGLCLLSVHSLMSPDCFFPFVLGREKVVSYPGREKAVPYPTKSGLALRDYTVQTSNYM